MQAFRREYIAFNDRHALWGEEESLDTLFRRAAAIHPERIALVDRNSSHSEKQTVRYSFRQLADAVARVSVSLFTAGVRQHRVVLIQMASHTNAVILKLAIARIGAIVCAIPGGFSRREWRLLLTSLGSDAAALVRVESDTVDQSNRQIPDLPDHCLQFSFGADTGQEGDSVALDPHADCTHAQRMALGEYLANIHVSPDDYFTLDPSIESSCGEDGNKKTRLKVLPGSHNHWQGVASFIAERSGLQNGDVLVCPHVCQEPILTGVFLYNWLSSGSRLVLTDAVAAQAYIDCLTSERATFSLVTPGLASQLEQKSEILANPGLDGLRSMAVLPADSQGARIEALVSNRGVVPIPLRKIQGILSVIE